MIFQLWTSELWRSCNQYWNTFKELPIARFRTWMTISHILVQCSGCAWTLQQSVYFHWHWFTN